MQKVILLIVNILLAIVVIYVPTIIIGRSYGETSYMGSLLTAEFIMRVISFIIGLLIIYDSIKKYFINE